MDVDERLKKDMGVARRSRELDDQTVSGDRELSDDERLEMFRTTLFDAALPDLPDIPGFHVCWLSTTHPTDTIHKRIRLGYQPIQAADIPGMDFASVKTGEWAGLVGVNEMVAFKLPMRLYQAYMKEAHFDAPNREAGKLTDTADFLREQANRDGGKLIEGDGLQDLRRTSSAPADFV